MTNIVPIHRHREYSRQTKRSAAGVLRDARSRSPVEIMVIGIDIDGDLFVMGSPPDPCNAMWLMELAKQKLTGLR